MTKYETATNQMQQLSGYMIDKTLDSPEKREDTDFISRNLFPIIAEVNRSISAPSFLLLFQYGILYFQLFFGSYFVFHKDSFFSNGFLKFCQVIFFGTTGDRSSATLFFIILFVIDFFTLLIVMLILLDYRNSHEFKNWQLNILRIWHGILFTYFIFPNLYFLSFATSCLYIDFKWPFIFLFIASLLSVAYTFIHVLYLSNLLNQSPFLFHTTSFHWRFPELLFMFIICTIPYVVDGFAPNSSSGFRYFPPILTIIASFYVIYNMFYFSFTYLFSNVVWSSASVGMIANSIFIIIRTSNSLKIHRYIQIFVPFGLIFVSFPIIWILFSIRRKRIKKCLMYENVFPEGEEYDQGIEQAYLSTLNINRKRKAFTYIQIGIEESADLFLDWSLSKHIFENFEEDGDILLFLTWTVSFFPSEATIMLRTFIDSISNLKKLSIVNRCMFYQLNRLNIFRQSSSMAEANADLLHMQKMTDRCTSNFCQIWKEFSTSEFDTDLDYYSLLTSIRRSTEAAWAEVLDKYPNDARLANEYSRFLLDCRCQFRESIHYHQRAIAIEKGTRLQNDRMFHRFVQMFPFYLKKGIVDITGKIRLKYEQQQLQKQLQQQQQQQHLQQQDYSLANQMQNDSSYEDSSDEIDLVEAEQYIPHAQLRFAFEKAVSEIDSPVVRKVIATEIISVLIALVYFVIIVVMLIHINDEKKELFSYLSSINKVIETYEMMAPIVTKIWSNHVYGKMTNEKELEMFGPSFNEMPNYLNTEASDNQTIFNLSLVGLSYLDDFSNALYHSTNKNGYKILNLTKLISDTPINSAICIPQNNTLYKKDQYQTIDFLWRSLFLLISKLIGNTDFINQTEISLSLCEAYTKNHMLSEAMKLIFMNVSQSFSYEYQLLKRCNVSHFTGNNQGGNVPSNPLSCQSPPSGIGEPMNETILINVEKYTDENRLNFLIAFTPFLILALIYPSTVFLSSGIWTERVDMTKKLQSFSKQECLDAAEVIIKKEEDENNSENDLGLLQETKKKTYIITYLINIFCILAVISLPLTQLISAASYNRKLNVIIEHFSLITCLYNTMITSAHNTVLLVFLNEAKSDNIFIVQSEDLLFIKNHIQKSLKLISLISNMLKKGYYNIPSLNGFIGEIDKIFVEEQCIADQNSKFIIDYYKCASLEYIFDYFFDSIATISNSYQSYQTNSKEMKLFSKLIETRLALGFLDLSNKYVETFYHTIRSFILIVWICFLVVVVFTLMSFGIELFMIAISNRDLDTLKSLILRVDPVAFSSNPQALSLIYGKKSLVDTRIISASHSVFYSSSDAMMSLNQDGIIESLNPAASNIFGYTPEQMLGQNIKLLINPEIKNNNQLFYTIQLMKSGQCSLIFESDFAGSRDDETILPLKVTLIGFSSNDRVAGSFAIICRDKTEDEKLRIEVENAQRESEDLLLQFVPQEMLSKINKEDPEYGFSVPSSTFIIINIAQFSSYIESVQPEELLNNLAKIFRSFDKILSTIPTANKIKVIGDIYFAADGLFNPDLLPSLHATDMVAFALKTLDSIEELNIQLNSELQIRIGIHSGGPTIAGVFGPDKKIFEVIGKPVSACQQLERRCIPGTVNISNDTCSLLPPGRFHAKEHELIELEGTEKQMTFTLHPGHISASPTNNSLMYTPPSLDALLGGGGATGNSFNMDIMSPFPDDGGTADAPFAMPSLTSLIDPQNEPPQ